MGRKANCWKKVYLCSLILILFSAIVYVELPGAADYPHNESSNAIICSDCHTGEPPVKTNLSSPADVLCGNCHTGAAAPLEKTHSSQNTSGTYGTWSVECITCHDAHLQQQVSMYGGASYLYTSQATSVTSGTDFSTISRNGAGWTPQQWKGMLVIGNTASSPQVFHKINDNTADTLNIEGSLTDVVSGNTFAIVYGGLIKSTINYTKTNVTPNMEISGPTKFFRTAGDDSFTKGTDIAGNPPVSTQGICMLCHTKTQWHKNDGSGADHYTGEDCISCHRHEEGFNKPATAGDGATAGLGGSGNGGIKVLYANSWAPGDSLKALNDPNASYDPNTKKCTGVYCHSNGADGASSNVATATSPAWNSTMSAYTNGNVCGGCHDNPPQYAGQAHYTANGYMGKEGGHLVGMHFDNISSNTSGLATAGVDGTSSHGNSAYSTTISCNTCHNGIVDGTIDTHAMAGKTSAFKCSNCHTGSTPTPLRNANILNKSMHVNGTKNVVLADATTIKSKAQLRDGSMPASWTRTGTYKATGSFDSATINSADYSSGAKTCVTACHIGKPVGWGDTGLKCSSCHKSL